MIVKIEGFANGGYGIARIDKKTVFVRYALPDETVEIEIVKEKKSYAIAQTTKVLEASPFRVKPRCKYYGMCGGCNLQHATYDYQLELKKEAFKNVLKRIAKIEIDSIEIEASPKQFNYRRRVEFKCRFGHWGFFKEKSNEFVKIDYCHIADDQINEFIKKYRCSSLNRIEVDDFSNINTDEMMLDLGLAKPLFYKKGAFSQINREVNLKLIEELKNTVNNLNISTVVEFFCGIGNFTIPLATEGYKITAIEFDTKAISSLRRNINSFKLKNVRYKKINLMEPFKLNDRFDLALLDPPRDGAKLVSEWIIRKKPPYVIYISCDPATLSRDLNILKSLYSIEKIKLFDMFPQTHHIESFLLLKLNKSRTSS